MVIWGSTSGILERDLPLVSSLGDWGFVAKTALAAGDGERLRLNKVWAEDDLGLMVERVWYLSGVPKNFLDSSAKETNLGFFNVEVAGQSLSTTRAALSLLICNFFNESY